MMKLPRFEYLEAKNVQEVISLLSKRRGEVIVCAGGTDILAKMKHKIVLPKYLLNLQRVNNMRGIEYDEKKGLRIGTLTTLEDIANSQTVKERFVSLSQAAGRVASPQIRNMATIGGNICLDCRCWYYNQSQQWRKSRPTCFKRQGEICHLAKGAKGCSALFQADVPPVLVALGAKVRIIGPIKERLVNIDTFYTQKGERANILEDTEFIHELQIPTPPRHSGDAYLKLSQREAIDFPIVGAASQISLVGDKCKNVSIVLTAVASGPVRVKEAEEVLLGNTVTDSLIEESAHKAQDVISPLPHLGVPAAYKRKAIGVMVKRSLAQAWNMATGG